MPRGGSGAGDSTSSSSTTTTTTTTTSSTSSSTSSSSTSTTGAGGGGTGGGGGGAGGSEPACDYGAPNTCAMPTEIEAVDGEALVVELVETLAGAGRFERGEFENHGCSSHIGN